MFLGRAQELTTLTTALDTRQAALIVVSGRRGLGKSHLIREACVGRTVIYLSAPQETARLNFETFRRICREALGDSIAEKQTEWLGLLSSLAMTARETPGLVIVLDNFDNLIDGDEGIVAAVRTFWQSGLPAAASLKLILAGSNITRMTELVRVPSSPAQPTLSDCKVQLLDLLPLPLREAAHFFPDYTDEARIAAYAIFGGVPAYLRACRPDRPLRANIVDLLLTPEGRLTEEPIRLLSAELRDIKVYAGIVRAIANGYRESSDIRAFVIGPHSGVSISSYLEKLRLMRLIADVRAVDASPKARYIRFNISDPLVRFWNLFVQPNRTIIERGDGEALFDDTIKQQLGEYMLQGFQDVCRDFVRRNAVSLFGAPADIIGQAWGNGYDLAIAGRLEDKRHVYGACEWHTRPVGMPGADFLAQQAELSQATAETQSAIGERVAHPIHVLCSRAGFTEDVLELARMRPSLRLLTPADIVQ